jgi:hypothetical protein
VQLLQPVTLKGGNEVFDDLDLRAFELEKLSTQAHLPAVTVLANEAHFKRAVDFLFSIQMNNAFVPDAALLDMDTRGLSRGEVGLITMRDRMRQEAKDRGLAASA